MPSQRYYRPLAQIGQVRPKAALPLAGGSAWFTHAECLSRDNGAQIIAACDIPQAHVSRLTAPRAPIAGLSMERPNIMGIVNTTPDSFSDGGLHYDVQDAVNACLTMVSDGADILDIGGESTRPGAAQVDTAEEIRRTQPVIAAVSAASHVPLSVDTRKAAVARAAFDAGAHLANDVSGLQFDAEMAPMIARAGHPVCIMHAQGTPDVMQNNPSYDNVLLDVYDTLAEQVAHLEDLGVPRAQIIVDPGIGFGKTQAHNLALLAGLSLFHGLGCAILLGVSRKRFIGTIGGAEAADARAPGSIALALDAVRQGVQILRVHDVAQTHQALALWAAVTGSSWKDEGEPS